MNSLAALLVPLTLLVPVAQPDGLPGADRSALTDEQVIEGERKVAAPTRRTAKWLDVALPFDLGPIYQVRIERRIILKVSPRRNPIRQNLTSTLPSRVSEPRYVMREMDECVPVSSIAAVQAERGNRLLLHLSDRTMVAADLEKSCPSRNFYSGFYIERNDDERLCADRDMLYSRSGAKCRIADMNRLVPVENQ